jgi:hypothetical protein
VRHPAGLVAIPLVAGSLAAILLFDRLPDLLAFHAAASASIALVAALAAFGGGSTAEGAAAVAAGALLAGFSLGASAAERAYGPPLLHWFASVPAERANDPWLIEGVLREDAAPTSYGTSLSIDVDSVGHRAARGDARPAASGSR